MRLGQILARRTPERGRGSGVPPLDATDVVHVIGQPPPVPGIAALAAPYPAQQPAYALARLLRVGESLLKPLLTERVVVVVTEIALGGRLQKIPPHHRRPTQPVRVHGRPDHRTGRRRRHPVSLKQCRSPRQVLGDPPIHGMGQSIGQPHIVATHRPRILQLLHLERSRHIHARALEQRPGLRILRTPARDSRLGQHIPKLRPHRPKDEHRPPRAVLQQRPQTNRHLPGTRPSLLAHVPLQLMQPDRGTPSDPLRQRVHQCLGGRRIERMPQPPPGWQLGHRLPARPRLARGRLTDQHHHPARAPTGLSHHRAQNLIVGTPHIQRQHPGHRHRHIDGPMHLPLTERLLIPQLGHEPATDWHLLLGSVRHPTAGTATTPLPPFLNRRLPQPRPPCRSTRTARLTSLPGETDDQELHHRLLRRHRPARQPITQRGRTQHNGRLLQPALTHQRRQGGRTRPLVQILQHGRESPHSRALFHRTPPRTIRPPTHRKTRRMGPGQRRRLPTAIQDIAGNPPDERQ
ncbi:putative monooxygenase [Streptomyces griseoaurantiacus M045]|uniref:Putative monooxygenase n=1 Tax=Streptomyces griseoaurantiacus M045 TaxID=996637 RepID=F3NE04_9ACTN|nr:putative monooxygenase [Streptomyces griseoaurantiacus M045]